MVVIPGLTDSLSAVGKRITHFKTTEGGLAVDIASTVRSAQRPKCSHRSSRRHGQYRRRLSAEPSMGRPVSLGVEMRRFKCVNRQCSQATFAEQIDALALPKQRRTVGLDGAWRSIAQALGGSAASRLATTLGMPTSRDTLLRRLRRLGSNATPPTPVVVGIDDWAITRGHRYGTIAVDLERRCPIEVLDGRESTSVADWLQRHPSIKVVARDRAGAYSEAVQKVIPHAQQVADRWHLLANLRETVERLLLRHNARLREAAQLVVVSPLPPSLPSAADGVVPLMAWQKLSIDRRLSPSHPPARRRRMCQCNGCLARTAGSGLQRKQRNGPCGHGSCACCFVGSGLCQPTGPANPGRHQRSEPTLGWWVGASAGTRYPGAVRTEDSSRPCAPSSRRSRRQAASPVSSWA